MSNTEYFLFRIPLLFSMFLFGSITFASESPLLFVNFETHPEGTYTREMVDQDWDNLVWASLHDRAQIVIDNNEQNKALRIAYPQGSVGPSEGGGQFLVSLPPSEELWFSYRMMMGEGFDFNLGGKLPGLTSGGGRYTGGRIPTEGDGWSARYMWRRGGRIGVYAYYVDMPGPWGQTFVLDEAATINPGEWHRITQRVKVNTPGESDGALEVWFDGEKVLSIEDLRWRVGEQGVIDSLFFSTFHGGNTEDWAPSVDSFAYFDDFIVSKTPLDVMVHQS